MMKTMVKAGIPALVVRPLSRETRRNDSQMIFSLMVERAIRIVHPSRLWCYMVDRPANTVFLWSLTIGPFTFLLVVTG